MRFWWVSQNQTFDQEVAGGYMWSPKRQANQLRNHYYETMREVARGDLIISFRQRKIMAIGVAVGPAFTSPKPEEFGRAGINWNKAGWRVEVKYRRLVRTITPREHMALLRPLLPEAYSPIRASGDGNQMYLTEITSAMALAMIDLIGLEGREMLNEAEWVRESVEQPALSSVGEDVVRTWDQAEEESVERNDSLPPTEKENIIRSRRGQGLFRNRVAEHEKQCRITRVSQSEHLIASHIKPWRMSDNKERLDGGNGLMLTPNVDHFFDAGLISFRGNGAVLVSPVANPDALLKMGLPTESDAINVGIFSKDQQQYLEFHRDMLFLESAT